MGPQSPPHPGLARQFTWVAQTPTPKVIEDFLDHYSQTHYQHLAKRAKELIEEELGKPEWSDVHVNLRFRGKEHGRLEEKLKMRHADSAYQCEEDIWKDIHDLAGVRVILYMPSEDQREKVQQVIQNIWGKDIEPKYHDGSDERTEPDERGKILQAPDERKKLTKKKYRKRHLGYIAVHYRAKMKRNHEKRDYYSWTKRDKVEIQVVSALSHAWAEAGHDILYKRYAYGPPTLQEELLLDSLNGLIVSGDLLLQQSHELVMKRTYTKFQHREDFGIFLRDLDILQPREESAADHHSNGEGHSNNQESNGEVTPSPVEGEEHTVQLPLQWDLDGLDILLRFLTITGNNYPLAVRKAIKELGFPDDPKLGEIMRTFRPRFKPSKSMLATICLIYHLLLEYKEDAHQPQNLTTAHQCFLMMNALNLLQTFFGSAESTNKFLRDDIEVSPEVKASLEYLLTETCLQLVLDPHPQAHDTYQEKIKPDVEAAWVWFQAQAKEPQSVCGMVFRLAQMGATRDLEITALLKQLSIGSIVSRSSTNSFEDDAG